MSEQMNLPSKRLACARRSWRECREMTPSSTCFSRFDFSYPLIIWQLIRHHALKGLHINHSSIPVGPSRVYLANMHRHLPFRICAMVAKHAVIVKYQKYEIQEGKSAVVGKSQIHCQRLRVVMLLWQDIQVLAAKNSWNSCRQTSLEEISTHSDFAATASVLLPRLGVVK